MKIAITSKGTDWDSPVDPRFGRTEYILVYDTDTEELTGYDNRDIEDEAHGAGPKTAQILFDMKVNVLLTGNGPGGNAASVLEKAGIEVYAGAGEMTVKEAFDALNNKQLKKVL